jgi:hypothetical protein
MPALKCQVGRQWSGRAARPVMYHVVHTVASLLDGSIWWSSCRVTVMHTPCNSCIWQVMVLLQSEICVTLTAA